MDYFKPWFFGEGVADSLSDADLRRSLVFSTTEPTEEGSVYSLDREQMSSE